MRVLLIAHTFPPAPVVGAFRAAKVAEALRKAGHHVEVITARLPGESEAIRVEEPRLRVHAVKPVPHPRYLYLWVKRQIRRGADQDAATNGGSSPARQTPGPLQEMAEYTPELTPPAWKRLLLSLMMVPDEDQGFIPSALSASVPLFRRGIDLVYTTAPPFSDHLVGLLLKRFTGVRWAAEFRDPWSEGPERLPVLRSRPADAAHRWLERRCLARADHVIAVAEETRDLLTAKMEPRYGKRAILALNGIDHLQQAQTSSEGPFRILYTGTFGAGRDPRPFLEALASLKRRRALTAEDIQVEFIGQGRIYHGISIEDHARQIGISDLISFTDWMPQEWCRDRMADADLLLLLFRDQRLQIPNKLFDYLGARRPILALVDDRGEAARMLRQAGGHYLVTDSTPASMETALETAIRQRGSREHQSDEKLLREWTTEEQMSRLMLALGA